MEYAINRVTGRVESAAQASGAGRYLCQFCKKPVNHRSGAKRVPHFAHWPGLGSPECENFVPGQYGQQVQSQGLTPAERQKMELRLLIPAGRNRAGWSVELVLPPCRECQATLTLDVGGRIQTIDMRGMVTRRRVTAELSTAPYCIVAFSGKPDPSFEAEVERECLGLPTYGAAAFTVRGAGEIKDGIRTQELRGSEAFALLWREPAEPGFPDELLVDRLTGRQGWSLALVTVPDEPSPECTSWLQSFTGLPIAPPVPSIVPVWPFLTKNSSFNVVECVRSDTLLLSAKMMPVGQQDRGPTMLVQSASATLTTMGVERSPAFFTLKAGDKDITRVAEATNPDIEEFISFSQRPDCCLVSPAVELAFTIPEGARLVVPLHQRKCVEIAAKARMEGMRLEFLSMPPGAKGTLRVDGSETTISSGGEAPPHSRNMRLPPPDMLAKLISALADPECHVDIDFGGFGRLRINGFQSRAASDRMELDPALRSRLLSFMLQLRLSVLPAFHMNDVALVRALAAVRPEPSLIPHYRLLMKEILACGFEPKHFEGGASL